MDIMCTACILSMQNAAHTIHKAINLFDVLSTVKRRIVRNSALFERRTRLNEARFFDDYLPGGSVVTYARTSVARSGEVSREDTSRCAYLSDERDLIRIASY